MEEGGEGRGGKRERGKGALLILLIAISIVTEGKRKREIVRGSTGELSFVNWEKGGGKTVASCFKKKKKREEERGDVGLCIRNGNHRQGGGGGEGWGTRDYIELLGQGRGGEERRHWTLEGPEKGEGG